jgi:SapC
MSNHALLNNVDHKDLRIITGHSAALGDNVMFSLALPSEFRDLQAHYPIVFRKSDDGRSFESVALFGFEAGENLFLTDKGWDATYIPLTVARQPFLIGINGDQLMVHLDMDNPRVKIGADESAGEAVFLPHGGTTEYLGRMNEMLQNIHQGLQSMPPFIDTLLQLELLESFVLDVQLNDGSEHRLIGFYTINEEKVNALSGAVLEDLIKRGYLQAIFMAVASLAHFRDLIERKNRAHAG